MNKRVIIVILIISLFVVSGCEQYVGRKISGIDDELTRVTNTKESKVFMGFNPLNNDPYLSEDEGIINVIEKRGETLEYNYLEDYLFENELDETFTINLLNLPDGGDEITVFVYYEGLDVFYSLLGGYTAQEQIIVNLNDYIENTDFDVLISFGARGKRYVIIEPFDSENNEVTFDFSRANKIRTNIHDLMERKELRQDYDYFRIKINDEDGICGFGYAGPETIDNFVYVSNNVFNPNWQFQIFDYAITGDEESRNITHMALTINNISYSNNFNNGEIDDIQYEQGINDINYIINERDLNHIVIYVPDVFLNYEFIDIDNDYISSDRLPITFNFFFTENNWLRSIFLEYNRGLIGESISRKLYFEEYYLEYLLRDEPLEMIKKPNSLVLTNENIQRIDTDFPFLTGYLANDNDFEVGNYPTNYIHTPNPLNDEGYIEISTPNGNSYTFEETVGRWSILCDEGIVPETNSFFPGMECVEGNYEINWDFVNVIRNRNLYLDAVVHFDGEDWEIVDEDLRVVDLRRYRGED